jgi:hypothetical protein
MNYNRLSVNILNIIRKYLLPSKIDINKLHKIVIIDLQTYIKPIKYTLDTNNGLNNNWEYKFYNSFENVKYKYVKSVRYHFRYWTLRPREN